MISTPHDSTRLVAQEDEFSACKSRARIGNTCDRLTVGLLQRRDIKIDPSSKCIGKESNSLESVDEGLEHSAEDSGGWNKVADSQLHSSLAYSALACFRMGMSASASFQSEKNS
jgi:hypothetical protein